MNSTEVMEQPQIQEGGHQLSPNDPESPMRWSLPKKLYVSASSSLFAFTILYGTTTYTAALNGIIATFNISPRLAILGFTMPFFGVFFAPIVTPHLSEKYGRRTIYLTSMPLFALFVVTGGLASNFPTVLATRFFAGFFGGPCLVLIEGTFADVWSAEKTVTYYSFLTLASFWGAGIGPVVGGFVFASRGPQWLNWVTLLIAVFSLAFGGAMPETYGREILRRRMRSQGGVIRLTPAQSGETIGDMARTTVLTPLKMIVTEPIVIATSLYVGLNFAVVFQWFITVPAVLAMVYDFTIQRAGLAFLSAVGGAALAVATSVVFDTFPKPKDMHGKKSIEARLYPAMLGSFLIVGSLFWVGFTASPKFNYLVPIFGTAVYVWGNMLVLISAISYLFDAYPPAGTLSALTAAACFRILCAGIVPIFILDMFASLTGSWALSVFGFISAGMLPFPYILFFFGPGLRARSSYSSSSNMSPLQVGDEAKHEGIQGSNNEV